MTKPEDIAKWMLTKLEEQSVLYQQEVVREIERIFGDEFVYDNKNGHPAIDKDVLKEFRKLTEKFVIWDRRGKLWRFREDGDPEKRQSY